jgi:hypothetical protein
LHIEISNQTHVQNSVDHIANDGSSETVRPGGDMTGAPNRLIAGILGIMALGPVVILTTGCGQPTTPRHRPSAPPAASATASDPPEGDHGDLYTPGPTLPAAPADATTAATAFAQAWARPHLSAGDWWTGIAPLCDQGLADRFRSTDPANVPATTITGPPAPAGPVTAEAALLAVPTDAGTLTVSLIHTATGWRVATIGFTRSVR